MEQITLPEPYTDVGFIEQLIIFKCLRPDKVSSIIRERLQADLGSLFVASQQYDLRTTFEKSDNGKLLIYFASKDSDAVTNILNLAKEKNVSEK